jgi:DNA-binding MarR family transcriptional regulator
MDAKSAKNSNYIVIRYNIGDVIKRPTQDEYRSLAELRYQIRKFLHFSEKIAAGAGLEPSQHQLLLALKGLPDNRRPRISELAERLQIRHHSAVELVDRLAAAGYVCRRRDNDDRRQVLVSLTSEGESVLRQLSLHHRAELRMRGPLLIAALRCVVGRKRRARVRPNPKQP